VRPGARRIGLLGGSFNPAHEGHLHISRAALARLCLDQVWWLVSPQNPLKEAAGMAAFADRLAAARRVAEDPGIQVTGIEGELGTVHTVDTIEALRRRFPEVRFVWLMGADNLVQIPRWKRWRRLFQRVPIAVFPRPTYSFRALSGLAARRFAGARVAETRAWSLADLTPPAWVFLHTRPHGASATRIRSRTRQPSKAAAGRRVPEQQARGSGP
jgi:nicotinate-nucleotide adenylyltransferase